MVYVTVKQSPMYRQMTLEEFLFDQMSTGALLRSNVSNTRTYELDRIGMKLYGLYDYERLIGRLHDFNVRYKDLYEGDRSRLYKTFHIPKSSGHGLRRIDAPEPELMGALRELKRILEEDFGALYHTSAFAYVKNRSTLDAVKRHQENESKWFGKYDLTNFFGNTTMEFVMNQLSMIFPFSEIMRSERGRAELERAIGLSFLNGGLPQGTPVSPTITNIMMIPVDYTINKALRSVDGQRFVYTRYADDFIISSRKDFNYREVERLIVNTLNRFGATFSLNESKTRYGSSSGRNWNLGVMLNKDNQITIGHRKKRQFQAMINSYILDRMNGHPWALEEVQALDGYRSYYKMVEGDTIDRIIEHIGNKYDVNILACIREDLK